MTLTWTWWIITYVHGLLIHEWKGGVKKMLVTREREKEREKEKGDKKEYFTFNVHKLLWKSLACKYVGLISRMILTFI